MKKAAVLALLLFSLDAFARVGGGEGYSGGGGGGGGGGGYSGGGSDFGGGGGGGDLGGLVYLLVRLCIDAPAIGIPLVMVIAGVVVYANRPGGGRVRWSTQHQMPMRQAPVQVRPNYTGMLTRVDRNFSLPLFLDWVNLVYVRGQEARGTGDRERLVEHFAPNVVDALFANRQGLTGVRNVIVGSTKISGVQTDGDRVRVEVTFESNVTEKREQETQFLITERWVFSRKTGVLSPGPDKLRTLGCPSCGSTLDPKSDGRCPNCETLRTGGENQWQVTRLQLLSKKAITPPELGGSGVEAGTNRPTRYASDLAVERRKLETRHPEHSWTAFRTRVEAIFLKLQQAWDAGRWEDARPYETDALFQQHRFWIERYKTFGLRNRLADVRISNVEVSKIATDAFYEAITVRIHASMRDWTIRVSDNRVMGGNESVTRSFSEYWTFLRTIGTAPKPPGDAEHCPSCGAPLDKVSMAGVCGYCEAKIVTGDFDWVLSRIEQDESYEG